MKTPDDLKPEQPGQGFQFPGVFEITVVGATDAHLDTRVPPLFAKLDLGVIAGSTRMRPSREGNYVSLTLSFACPTREKYDAVHALLRAEPSVRWTI